MPVPLKTQSNCHPYLDVTIENIYSHHKTCLPKSKDRKKLFLSMQRYSKCYRQTNDAASTTTGKWCASKLNNLTRQLVKRERQREFAMLWLYMILYYIGINVETEETNSPLEGVAYQDDLTRQNSKDEHSWRWTAYKAIGSSESWMHPMAEKHTTGTDIPKEIRRKNLNDMKKRKIM